MQFKVQSQAATFVVFMTKGKVIAANQAEVWMPEKKTIERARKDAREGKSPSTQAGEFVREEMEHVREGKHGARNTKQAIAIGLSKARRAGVKLAPPKSGSEKTKAQARRDTKKGESGSAKTSATRSRATTKALKREGHSAASRSSLSNQARTSARHRTSESRSQATRKAARTRARHRS
ncbi:MAG TPA: DUF6496 domain-containing protein [Bryobacteraceae bacterium]|nr:DUF6496 domain-containing protein [Bryobacteraceae bacterium]